MGRMTIRIPDSLHKQLAAYAENEGVSLNQYIVYALTKDVSKTGHVGRVPQEDVAEQARRYEALLSSLGKPSDETMQQVLDAREQVEAEEGLTAALRDQLVQKIAGQR